MIQLIITALICLANSSLLIYSFANLGPIFVGYFFITQAITSWFLIDSIISYQSDKAQQRKPIENIHFNSTTPHKPVIIPAQAQSLQSEVSPSVEEIDYELDSMEFSSSDFGTSASSNLIFIEK